MKKKLLKDPDSRTDKRLRRERDTGCSRCPPHGGENKRHKKHGVKKPKYKTV